MTAEWISRQSRQRPRKLVRLLIREGREAWPIAVTRRRAPQGDAELMAKEEVLSLKPAPRLEQVDDEGPSKYGSANIVRDHAIILLDDATPKPDGIFGKDRVQAIVTKNAVR